MLRFSSLTATVFVLALTTSAAPVSAAPGNGAYAPFPTPISSGRAAGFYDALGVDLSRAQLKTGVYVTERRPVPVAPAVAERAGLPGDDAGLWTLVIVLLGAAATAGATAMMTRRTHHTE